MSGVNQRGVSETFGGGGRDYGRGLVVDGGGNVYIVGTFTGMSYFGPGTNGDAYSTTGLADADIKAWTSIRVLGWKPTHRGPITTCL